MELVGNHEVHIKWDFLRNLWMAECRDCEVLFRASPLVHLDIQYEDAKDWVEAHLQAAIYYDWLKSEVDQGHIHLEFTYNASGP